MPSPPSPAPPPRALTPGDVLAFFRVDDSECVAEWSAGAEATFGYAAHEIVGIPAAVLQQLDAPRRDIAVRPPFTAERETAWVRRDGEIVRASHLTIPVLGAGGAPLGTAYLLHAAPAGSEPHTAHNTPRMARPVFTYDLDGRLVDANPTAEALVGLGPGARDGKTYLHGVAPEDWPRLDAAFRLAAEGTPHEVSLTLHPPGDNPVSARMVYLPRNGETGAPTGVYAVARDPGARLPPDHAGLFRMLVEENDQVFFYRLDAEGRMEYVSPTVERVLGYLPGEMAGRSFDSLRVAGSTPGGAAGWGIEENRPVISVVVRHAAGHPVILERIESVVRGGERPVAVVGVARDVTQRKRMEDRLVHDARHDPLTGLANRVVLDDRIQHAARMAQRRPGERFAVVALDLDRFKPVNDRLGHPMGDTLLVQVARRLEGCVRVGDTVCRLGGDEFVALLEGVAGAEDAAHVADRMRAALDAPFRLGNHELTVGASLGLALSGPAAADPDELLRHADAALYSAKAAGGSRVVVYDRDMRNREEARTKAELELRGALERGELALAYQPVVSLRTGEIEEFEALVRWPHPTRGTLAAAEFLPLAEDSGVIAEIDRWVVAEAIRQLGAWRSELPGVALRMSVNLSNRRLVQRDFAEQLRRLVVAGGVAPGSFTLEVPEEVLATPARLGAVLSSDLRRMGVLLQIHNFGTGSSSLRGLRRLPVHALKIDRSLVCDAGDPELVRAAISMAHGMELAVVAEGVETAVQLDRLREMRCDFAQGFLFSGPVDSATAGSLLHSGLAFPNAPRGRDTAPHPH